MNIKQIQQITQFLSAYPKDIVEAGIEAWRTGEMPTVIEGRVTEASLTQEYKGLTEKQKETIKEMSEKMKEILPFCKCGKQLNLMGVN